MKKISIFLSALFLTLGLAFPAFAENDMNEKPKVELTEEQKAELAAIHDEILKLKFQMVDKHVEFGVIPKDTGEKIKEKLQMKAEKMKENGYVPRHCNKHKD